MMADRYSELSPREQMFVDRYIDTLDPRQAALEAGYALDTARTTAYSWVKDPGRKPTLYETVEHRRKERLKGFAVEAAEVRQLAWRAATVDPTSMVEYRRTSCRWCHGVNHLYQWTLQELQQATAAAERLGSKLPSIEGGVGFNATRDPHPECPECFGEGVEIVRPKDSRDLTADERLVFRGFRKLPGGGFEVITKDQSQYLRLFAELCGFKIDRKEVTGKDGAPLIEMPSVIQLVAGGEADDDDDEGGEE